MMLFVLWYVVYTEQEWQINCGYLRNGSLAVLYDSEKFRNTLRSTAASDRNESRERTSELLLKMNDAEEIDYGYGTPGNDFKEAWQVKVKPKGLGKTKNLTGVYRLCLFAESLHLIKLNSETPCVNLELMTIRCCGHSERFFYIELGPFSSIGPGDVWMQVADEVVARNMHTTILETMKALKAFRPRSRPQSNPMGFITTPRHLGNLPPSLTGLQRQSRTESVVGTPPIRTSSGASGSWFPTSSEGESTMNRPFRSVTGSLIHLNMAYANSDHHARSALLPVSHFPSTTSMSSSSRHGSVSDTSSDENSFSPGDFCHFRVRSNTPEHCLSDYMAMGWNRDASGTSTSEACEESANEYSRPGLLRRRTPSFSRQVGGASAAGVAVYQKTTQTTFSLDKAVSRSWGASAQAVSTSSSLCSDYSSSSEHSQDRPPSLQLTDAPKDDGYMPMMAGVLPASNNADYMFMQPNVLLSASPRVKKRAALPVPQHVDSQGYMTMLPCRSGITDSPAPSSLYRRGDGCRCVLGAVGTRSSNRPVNTEYMDMSQRTSAAPSRDQFEHDEYVPMRLPAKLISVGKGMLQHLRVLKKQVFPYNPPTKPKVVCADP